MKKKKIIKKLDQRVKALEKQLTPSSLTLFDPDNENKTVVICIANGKYTQDSYIKNTGSETSNITSQPI